MQNSSEPEDGNRFQVKKKAEAGYAVLSCECGAGNCSTLNMRLHQQPEIHLQIHSIFPLYIRSTYVCAFSYFLLDLN